MQLLVETPLISECETKARGEIRSADGVDIPQQYLT